MNETVNTAGRASAPLARIGIAANGPTRPWRRFWRSTGFSPAELLLEPEMQQTLAYVGGVPNRGIEYLRVHYMLDLVRAARPGQYDWTLLDEAIDVILKNRLRPFFELMGNPGHLFTDFRKRDEVHHWRDLVAELAERCIGRWGREEVRSWYFETWNEPDIWWRLGEAEGFNNYYDACAAGLWGVDEKITFGGAGTCRTLSPMFRSFMAHCDSGANYFTGERGQRIDFISVHEKGAKKHAEDITPDTVGICRKELQAVHYLREHHPRLAKLPFINNECDPQIGWILSHTWHAMPYFAGVIAKIIDQHQRLMVDAEGVDYDILSNDNGFLGRWGHRTHLAYFGSREILAAQAEHQTDLDRLATRRANPKPFDLIKKPALSVAELLALLGTDRLPATAPDLAPDRDGLGVIATRLPGATDGAAILLYDSVDRIWESGRRAVELDVTGLPPGEYILATFRIEHGKGDPFSVWESLGAPDEPDAAALAALRRAQEPELATQRVQIHPGDESYRFVLDLRLPSVVLAVVARAGGEPPSAPAKLTAETYQGLNGENVLLFWEPAPHPSVQLFQVLSASDRDGPYAPVSEQGLLSSVFVLPKQADGRRFYAVRALDLFGRTSAESEPVEL